MIAFPLKKSNWLIALVFVVAVASWQAKRYADARTECYFFPNGEVDKAEVLNACVADGNSKWKLPALVNNIGVLPFLVSSANCRIDYNPNLFFVEKHFACQYFEANKRKFLAVDEDGGSPLHDLARRHNACRSDIDPRQCSSSQIRSIDLLLENGIDLELKEFGKDTILEVAAFEEDVDLVRALVSRGADRAWVTSRLDGRNVISHLLDRQEWCVKEQYGDACVEPYRQIIDILEGDDVPTGDMPR